MVRYSLCSAVTLSFRPFCGLLGSAVSCMGCAPSSRVAGDQMASRRWSVFLALGCLCAGEGPALCLGFQEVARRSCTDRFLAHEAQVVHHGRQEGKSLTMDPTEWPVIVLPGIGNSGPLHWQTLWEQRRPHWLRVNQREWDHPVREEWVDALDAAVAECVQPPVLVAHSIGCLAVVHWASRSCVPVRAAFLVAVPDPGGDNFPSAAQGFIPLPLAPLRMPSLVVASTDDSFSPIAYARNCASAWGSQFVEIGPAGHINAESGHGAWPEGFRLLRQLLREETSMSLDSRREDEA